MATPDDSKTLKNEEDEKSPFSAFKWISFEGDRDKSPFAQFLSTFEATKERLEYIKKLEDDPNETGWDRVKYVWQKFDAGEECIEGRIISTSFIMGGVAGGILGGIYNHRETVEGYIRQHNTNLYAGKHSANRAISDRIYISFVKKGLQAGFRCAIFSGLFVGSTTLAATYRNDVYFRDFAMGGAATGMVFKGLLGPRAMLVNALVGSVFGLIFAASIKLTLKIGDTSVREIRLFHKPLKDCLPVRSYFRDDDPV